MTTTLPLCSRCERDRCEKCLDRGLAFDDAPVQPGDITCGCGCWTWRHTYAAMLPWAREALDALASWPAAAAPLVVAAIQTRGAIDPADHDLIQRLTAEAERNLTAQMLDPIHAFRRCRRTALIHMP